MKTDLRTCDCGTRIIFPRTPTGKKLPPVDYMPDPVGTVAVQHAVTGAWLGRFLAKDEQPVVPEKRYALHWCEHSERRQRRRGRRSPAPRHPRQAAAHGTPVRGGGDQCATPMTTARTTLRPASAATWRNGVTPPDRTGPPGRGRGAFQGCLTTSCWPWLPDAKTQNPGALAGRAQRLPPHPSAIEKTGHGECPGS